VHNNNLQIQSLLAALSRCSKSTFSLATVGLVAVGGTAHHALCFGISPLNQNSCWIDKSRLYCHTPFISRCCMCAAVAMAEPTSK